MNRRMLRFPIWLATVLILIVAPLVAAAAPAAAPPAALAPYDPYILTVMEAEGEAEFFVVLKVQADLTAAEALLTKEAKGEYVFEALTEVAAKTQGPILGALAAQGADYEPFWIQNMIRVRGDKALLMRMAARPDVSHIFYEYEPILDEGAASATAAERLEAIEWNILRVNADDVWGLGITGDGAVIADLDTGVDWEHPALVNSYRPQIPGAPGRHDYNWWDGPGGSPEPIDYGDHGTHTMGTIVGDDGGANQIGVAPGADWIACAGLGDSATAMDCFQFFLAPTKLDGTDPRPDLAPHVISNSWSSASDYREIIEVLYAAGIFYAKSAGNEGSACETITKPGQWPEVTATAAFANGDVIAGFSSRGPVTIGHETIIKPDVAAPGVSVRSSLPGGGYGYKSGTSMACPHVTGAVALLISANPELAGQVDVLQKIIKQTAEPKIDLQCPPNDPSGVPNNVWGHGILDTYSAVNAGLAMDFGGIEGTVYDSDTMDPVAEAFIALEDSSGWNLFDQSEGDGSYGRTLPADTYEITTTHYGYLPGLDSGVVIEDGVITPYDISLDPAPVWTVSGTVLEGMTNDPLAATIVFEETPIIAETDPDTGEYSTGVAQGTWWMHASSPGHASEERQVTVDQDQTQDFSLPAIYNYYMLTSNDMCDPPVFDWLDATGGDELCLSDDSYMYVPLPSGQEFTFYGNTYTWLYVGSNGFVTFGMGWNKWSGPIPDPAMPNNGIYGFSMDLNPASCSQGSIYTDYLDDRYFVIQFDAVEHYPSGNPETFEIILDLQTGLVVIQLLTVSDPSVAVVGVENADGTEATQYAYGDPGLITDLSRVEFYPVFGSPPPTGPGEVQGIVSDVATSLPIEGAMVSAVASGGGDPFEFTTGPGGDYAGQLCPDTYTMLAEAVGYYPSEEVEVEIFAAETTFQDFVLEPYRLYLPLVLKGYGP